MEQNINNINSPVQSNQKISNRKIARLLIILPIVFFLFSLILSSIAISSSGTMFTYTEAEAIEQENRQAFWHNIYRGSSILSLISLASILIFVPFGIYNLRKKTNL